MADQPYDNNGSGPVLDERALENLRELVGDDPVFIGEFIDSFLRIAPKQIQEIREGIANGDPHRVRMAAHTLKSNSADVGAKRLSSVARRFEHAGRDDDLESLADGLASLEAAFDEARGALSLHLGG